MKPSARHRPQLTDDTICSRDLCRGCPLSSVTSRYTAAVNDIDDKIDGNWPLMRLAPISRRSWPPPAPVCRFINASGMRMLRAELIESFIFFFVRRTNKFTKNLDASWKQTKFNQLLSLLLHRKQIQLNHRSIWQATSWEWRQTARIDSVTRRTGTRTAALLFAPSAFRRKLCPVLGETLAVKELAFSMSTIYWPIAGLEWALLELSWSLSHQHLCRALRGWTGEVYRRQLHRYPVRCGHGSSERHATSMNKSMV